MHFQQFWVRFLLLSIAALALQAAPVFGVTGESIKGFRFITVDIPTSSGQFGFTTLADINDNEQISGGFTDTNAGPFGFILDKKMRQVEIRCSKDVIATVPQGINKHGIVAGTATVITERIPISFPPFEIIRTKTSGFFRNKSGRCTLLDFPHATLTEAIGINDDGQIVGDYRDAAGNFHGFFWDAGLFLTIDVTIPGATTTGPTAINNVGQIVGSYFDNLSPTFPNGRTRGFIYDKGEFTTFDFPHALVTVTLPVDINDSSQIVGVYSDGFSNHSFLLHGIDFTDIDVGLSDTLFTEVSGINNKGQIVGRYVQNNPADPANPFSSHGFIGLPKNRFKSVPPNLVN